MPWGTNLLSAAGRVISSLSAVSIAILYLLEPFADRSVRATLAKYEKFRNIDVAPAL
jgi:hypothetical protein